MSLYGFNITPQDIWANRSREGQFKINGMTAEEWVKTGNGTYDEFWHVHRAQQLQENFNKIWTNSSNPSQFPLDGIFRMLGSTTDKSVLQTLNSMPKWERFASIKANGGQAVGFDLETFGDILNSNTNSSEFGITEFAIGRRIYDGTENINRSGRSYIFGIDDAQKNYLVSLNKKFQSQGWNALETSEQVALGRMSMYAPKGAIKEEYINNRLIRVAGELGPETRTVEAINAGISNLYNVHTSYLREGTSEKDIFAGLVNKIIEANNSDDTVLFGANSQYDITSIKNIAKRFGIDVSNIDNIKNNVLDVIYSARSLAASNNQSMNEYFRTMNGIQAGASMDEQLEVYRFSSDQKHQAFQDTMTEGDILDIRVNEITSVKDKLQNIQDNYKQYQGLEDSVFLIRNGKLNQEHAQEMGIIDGKPVTNYSFTNEYWTIDTKRSQYININGEQKYSLVLNNYVDGENTSVVWIRDSQEEAIEELTHKSSIFSTKQITKADAKWQQSFKYKDFGRREFDKMISPSSVGLDNGHDIYGFETLEKYLKLMDELPAVDVKDTDSIKKLMEYVNEHYDAKDKPFKSYYQAQAYAGMYNKLKNEEDLLKNIVEQINSNYGNATNIDKTIVLHEAYAKSIGYLDTIYERKNKSKANNTISDALGIDIIMPDDTIKRINGYNTDTITYDVNRIFSKLNNNEILDILEDMSNRGLLQDEEKYTSIAKRVASMSQDDLYGISQDLAYELSKITQDLVNKDGSIINAFNKGSKSKNKQFIGQNIEDNTLIRYKKKSFGKAYSESIDAINGIISNAINNRPDTVYMETTGDNTVFKNYINKIATELNLEPMSGKKELSTSGDLLYELFTKTKNYKGEPTKYAINNYIDKGLSTFMTIGENGNAYLFLTKQEDAAKFYSNLIDGKFDLSSRNNLINPKSNSRHLPIHDYASFVELPKINEYQLSDNVLKTINQGKQEKIIIPQLNIVQDAGQKVRAYYNSGEYGFYSTLRMSMGGAIEHILYGEYEEGSASVRKAQNKYLEDLSTSASYRGRIINDASGNIVKVERIAEFTPNDYIQASEAKITNELYSLFKTSVQIEPDKDLNTAQKIVMEFGKHTNKNKEQYISSLGQMGYMNAIMNDSEFKEFFIKRLFVGNVSDDMYMSALQGTEFDKNIFSIIQDIVSKETEVFDKSVTIALSNIPTDTIINQILSETAQKKGIVSFGVRPGDYNDAASLYSTMRPTYSQQNNALSFSLDEVNNNLFIGFNNNPVRFNTAVIAAKEYNDRMALAKTYQPIPGKDYANRRLSMVSRVKQIGDYDLQLKYQDMLTNADEYAKELNISKKQYTDTLSFFQKNFMSLHEGKVFMAPGLSEQILFQERDAKKMIYNLDGLNIKKSRKIMENLVKNKTIVTRNTVIGIRDNGAPVFFNGPDSIFTSENITDFFQDAEIDTSARKSYIIPIRGDIADTKIMINGAEKGTVHAINMTSFMDYTGIKNHDKALKIANSMFDKIFDGAAIAANFGFEKHGNIVSTHSIWNTIISNYIESGYGEALVGYLNKMRLEQEAFKGIGEFDFINGEIISSSTDAYNFSAAVELLYDKIKNNEILQTSVNERIMQELDTLNQTHTYNAQIRRQNMNEHMGTRIVIDQRIEQGIRTRGMQLGGFGMEQIDNDWADILKEYSQRYDASGTSINGSLGEFLNVYGRNKNASRIHLLNAKTDTQRSAKGIVESLMYYYNPEKYNPNGKNIVQININDLIDKGIQLKGGLSVNELHNSIFFVNGKPSEFLQEQAKKSNVDLYDKSYSIFIDLNGTQFDISQTIDGKTQTNTFKGIMIPIQSVFDDIDDKVYFQSQQSSVASFMDKLVRIMSNPGQYENINQSLGDTYSSLIESLFSQIGYLNKDSDIYKAFQQYIMPTSQELLAQDEIAPLIDKLLTDDFKNLIDKKREYEAFIKLNPNDAKAISELDKIYESIDEKLIKISDDIKTSDLYYSLVAHGNNSLINASKTIINGKTEYGLAVAISREAFERQGIDIGAVGLEAFSNWETKNFDNGLDNIREFSKSKGFGRRKITIANQLNNLGIDGLVIDSKQSITEQLNTFFSNKYGLDDFSLSIKDLNKAITEGEGRKILSVFDNIGEMYLSEIGTFGELTRYPSFRSQPIVKVILDKTLEGKQIRGSSAILSSLTNVDFDGDKMFLAMLTDGISIINQGTKINGKNVLDISKRLFNRFAERESRGLLAELVRSGDALKVDDPNAITQQYAAILEKLKPEEYENVVKQWMKDNAISLNTPLTKAQKYALNNSPQMHDAFIKMGFNTITDIDSILSSIASRFRKNNIGAISTPNYHMRNSLLIALNDPNLSSEQKLLLNDTYVSLSNMLSKAGGFFSEAEQKSIDVKHAKDGLEVAKTTRYSTGMSILFGRSEHTVESNIFGIQNILEATNSGLFKASDEELQKMANLVANTTTDVFNNSIQEFNPEVQEYLKTLRKLLDVQREIPNFDKIYADNLIKGSLDDNIYNVIQKIESLNNGTFSDLQTLYRNTGFYNVLDVFANSFSKEKSQFVKNNIYFDLGSINGNWQDEAYIYNGNNKFKRIDIETGAISNKTLKINPKRLTSVGEVNIRDYINSSKQRTKVIDIATRKKFEKTLNEVLFDKKERLLSNMPDKFIQVGNLNGGINKYGSAWSAVNALFIGKTSDKNTSSIYKNIEELANTYDYAVSKNFINTSKRPSTSGELIREINKSIAENPIDKTSGAIIFDTEYDTILRKNMSEIFGSEEILERFIEESKIMSTFNTAKQQKYKESLIFLNDNTYDIIEQQKAINGSISGIQTELDALRKQGASDMELKPLQDVIDKSKTTSDNILKTLRQKNASIVAIAQQNIYELFDTTNQMDTFFGWNKHNKESIVGFGNYLGISFQQLSKSDIQSILEAGEIAKKSLSSMSIKEQYALTHTLDALKQYGPSATTSGLIAKNTSAQVNEYLSQNQDIITEVYKKIENRTEEQVHKASQRAASNTIKKKTLLGTSFDGIKNGFDKIPKKTLGIAVGSLVALGIANNLLHHDKNKSPVSPEFSNDHNDPGFKNDSIQSQQVAPLSKKTIYVDKPSGLQFKVSAKTQNYISDVNNAKLIGLSNGGHANIYSQQDTSSITDNWLANKFAELTD